MSTVTQLLRTVGISISDVRAENMTLELTNILSNTEFVDENMIHHFNKQNSRIRNIYVLQILCYIILILVILIIVMLYFDRNIRINLRNFVNRLTRWFHRRHRIAPVIPDIIMYHQVNQEEPEIVINLPHVE